MPKRFVLILLLFVLASCGGSADATATPDAATPGPDSSPSESIPTDEASLPVEPTDEPVESPSPSIEPSPEPTDETPSESPSSGAAAECSGSDDNRTFFEDAAAVLDCTVYCAVLPTGWSVVAGEFRRASGGRLEITYRDRSGARLELHEGAWCTAEGGCVPSGIDVGDAAFGDRTGTLIATDDGGWALVVDGDAPVNWLAVGTGFDEETFRSLTAALVAVSD